MNNQSDTNIINNTFEDVRSFDEKYALTKKIGFGSFSEVYTGVDLDAKKEVAVKVVDVFRLNEQEQMRLEREVAIMRELAHENILGLVDVYRVSNPTETYRIITDMMKGGDLLEKVEKLGSLDEKSAQSVCRALLSAVDYLHTREHPIVHRDIKLENILISLDAKGNSVSSTHLRLADFGFAIKESLPNSLSTMCGTLAYCAPEILQRKPYGRAVDLWSVGVVTYSMLAGYQPFHAYANDDAVIKNLIFNGIYKYDDEYWGRYSEWAKTFIDTLLTVDPMQRNTAKLALEDKWVSRELINLMPSHDDNENDTQPVFFMIGSQRSGSNWLRTMLETREDLAGPHPPHLMREFIPIIGKFGDLSLDENFCILLDHMCAFVEHNQVTWTDKHGLPISFCRPTIYKEAKESCIRLIAKRVENRGSSENHDMTEVTLPNELYSLSIFDAIMNYYAKANGKKTWLCKSMGMSQYHDYLLEFYGISKLRYIYLVRDPRDVAMSFMKTPVGDCCYYIITKKWVKLQEYALDILNNNSNLIYKVHYEELLADKKATVKKLFDFIGERRFGGIRRQASVMFMPPSDDLITNAHHSRESVKAHVLSEQFKNLIRGESFAKTQNQKWKDPKTGLDGQALEIIESVAFELMEYFGYETKLVGKSIEVKNFTQEEIDEFQNNNTSQIENMMNRLKHENVDDYNRRMQQANILKLDPKLISASCFSLDSSHSSSTRLDMLPIEILSTLKDSIEIEFKEEGDLTDFGSFTYGAASVKGYYPDDAGKQNQDLFDVKLDIGGIDGLNFLAVYDGHGPHGYEAARLAKTTVPEMYSNFVSKGMSTKRAMSKAIMQAHAMILKSSMINSSLSGTTSVSAILRGKSLTVCNVGDSCAIIGTKESSLTKKAERKMSARLLMNAHSLDRSDEVSRIEQYGGVVLSTEDFMKVKEGAKVNEEEKSLDRSLHRIWSYDSFSPLPGCAFTRSLGDSIAHDVGVSATPEFKDLELQDGQMLILASDGVGEWLSPKECVDIVSKYDDPTAAAKALVNAALDEWSKLNDYVDDITAIVVFISSDE